MIIARYSLFWLIASLTTSCLSSTVAPISEKGVSTTANPSQKSVPFSIAPKRRKARTVTLTISAAASLQNALQEAISVYETINPEVAIALNSASSGALQQQIEQGAPVDVFISAAPIHMDRLQAKGLLLSGTRKDVFGNQLVLITTPSPEPIASFDDLTDTTVTHIVMGKPNSVPAGTYGKEVLSSLDLYDILTPKLVFSKDVRQALAYVESGNVSAGLVYATDAALSENVEVAAIAEPTTHAPIVYPIAVLKQSRHPVMAQTFAKFLSSEQARPIFEKYGFKTL